MRAPPAGGGRRKWLKTPDVNLLKVEFAKKILATNCPVFVHNPKNSWPEKSVLGSERSQPEKFLTKKHPFLFLNAKRFVAPAEEKQVLPK